MKVRILRRRKTKRCVLPSKLSWGDLRQAPTRAQLARERPGLISGVRLFVRGYNWIFVEGVSHAV